MNSQTVVFQCLGLLLALSAHHIRRSEGSFCYEEKECTQTPDKWEGNCQDKENQSPIDLQTSIWTKTTPRDLNGNSRYFQNQTFKITNNGHTAQAYINADLTSDSILVGSLTKGVQYVFSQLHFHWGSNNSVGSEHTVNGRRYPLELHLVHYASNFPSLTAAIASNQSHALAVIGRFFYVNSEKRNNNMLSPIINALENITAVNSLQAGENLNISAYIPDSNGMAGKARVVSYSGSLTTPNCSPVVLWNVYLEPIEISNVQMSAFRNLLSGHGDAKLVNNYRPIQSKGSRTVEYLTGPLKKEAANN